MDRILSDIQSYWNKEENRRIYYVSAKVNGFYGYYELKAIQEPDKDSQ